MLSMFSVGITVEILDRATSALSGISGSLMEANRHTETFQKGLGKMQSQLSALRMMSDVGRGMFSGAMGSLESALGPVKEYQHQLNKLNQLGLSQADISKNVAAAWQDTGRVLNTTASENIRTMNELFSVMRNMGEARTLTPRFQESKNIFQSLAEQYGIAGKSGDELAFAGVKFSEMRGQVSQKASLTTWT